MNEYLKTILENKKKAADSTYNASLAQAERNKSASYDELVNSNRSKANEYMHSINPYGVAAEKRYSQGLSDAGYKNKLLTSTYNAYQNALGNNSAQYLNNLNSINNDLLLAEYNRQADYLSAENDYAQNAYDEYYRLLQLERQKQRDKIEDEQYEKEYQLRLKYS